jgi:hypothetical protein
MSKTRFCSRAEPNARLDVARPNQAILPAGAWAKRKTIWPNIICAPPASRRYVSMPTATLARRMSPRLELDGVGSLIAVLVAYTSC